MNEEETTSINSMLAKLEQFSEPLLTIGSYEFDCLEMNRVLGRENTFQMIIFKIIHDLP